jgi:hypothetical protein
MEKCEKGCKEEVSKAQLYATLMWEKTAATSH